MKQRVLFIGTNNADRTQMAEGYLRARYGDRYEACSAGIAPTALNPTTVQVMNEIGIDIAGQRAKDLGLFDGKEMDYVVALCSGGVCPMFPWTRETIHADFPDPARATGTPDKVFTAYRRSRDAICAWIDGKFGGK
ncbi:MULTISPECIES: arsenate reductase ArsC [unclassified Methanoculleus]|jgi:arsenate reductase|uniref:Arsenate reductase ArsC n=1 Tax=Methanoculleus palmolei TaxID=72612 RepID=A0ABD8AAA3_9EURY|nr:arsenate reductase ArsC [Methanoculleus sp. UBA377]MDD2474176.1 arsenate reductase ArsC [Methanoculleus sp.]WOX56464.1 arsenate reductase ArsC [Methanoculleus palmolei]